MLLPARCWPLAKPAGHLAAGPMAIATVLVACLATTAAAVVKPGFAADATAALLKNFSFELPFGIPEHGRRLSPATCPVTTGYTLLRNSPLPALCTITTTSTTLETIAAPTTTTTTSTSTSTTEDSNETRTTTTTFRSSTSTTTSTLRIVGCKPPHSLYGIGSSCHNMAPGTTCAAIVGSRAHSCIQQGAVEFSCPAGNVVNSEPYLISRGSIKCRACHIAMAVADVDDRPGHFQGTLVWGPNMIDGVIDETLVDRYYVLIVDSCNVVLSVVGMLPKRGDLPTSCCLTNAYELTFAVELPDNYDRFTVMAVKDATPKFIVQGGISSARIVDVGGVIGISSACRRAERWALITFAIVALLSH